MLYQDRLGILREIPDSQVYGLGFAEYPYGAGESQILYDGLGNPVGAWPFSNIAKAVGGLVSKALPAVASFVPGGSLISQALPALAQGMAPSPTSPPTGVPAGVMSPGAPSPYPVPQPVAPPGMQMGPTGMQMPYGPTGMPMYRPPAIPTGWVRPPLPYTGLGPRRLYMRCAVWPGPSGLVPEIAAQAPAAPAQAAAAAAAQTAVGLMRRPVMRRRRR